MQSNPTQKRKWIKSTSEHLYQEDTSIIYFSITPKLSSPKTNLDQLECCQHCYDHKVASAMYESLTQDMLWIHQQVCLKAIG